jgi:zinc protease
MKVSRLFFIVFFLLFHVHAYALNVAEHTLKNGLKVLVVEDHKAPTATFQIWYRVGSRDENIGKTGLSHLLEHMMFKGTKNYGPKTFSRTIQRAGAQTTHLHQRNIPDILNCLLQTGSDLPIELEADRMQNLVLTKEAVLSERDVVTEERSSAMKMILKVLFMSR